MDQRSKKKIKLFRTLKVFFYCLGVPLFVLAVMLSAGLDFVGELPFSVNEPVLGVNEGIESVFFGSGLYGVWVAFGVWLVIAIIHIILKKTVHNTRARTMLVAVVTFVVMLVPVVVMDIVMPMQLDKLAEETAADGVVIPSYKEQLANYVIKGEVREGYTAEFCEQVEKLLDVYHIEFEPVISNGIASNAANMPVRYEELWRDGDGAYTGDKTGLVKVQPDENGQLVVDGKVYDKYEFKNNVWYKTSRDSDFKDGVYGPAYYNVNGLLSEGYVFGIETVLNILEQYYKGQLDVAALGGNDSDYAKIVKKAAELQEEDYTSDPASEKYFIWKQTGFEIGGVDLNGDGLEEKLSLVNDEALWSDYGHLQESDHFYYMCTKFFSDGAVHKYFNPYDTPYEAFINYMNVLSDFILRVDDAISVSDANFAAPKKETKARTRTAKAVKAAPAAKTKSAKAEKPAAPKKRTVKTKKQ